MTEEFNLSKKELEDLRELDGTIDSRVLEIAKRRKLAGDKLI